LSGFVPVSLRSIFLPSITPSRWAALSDDAEEAYKTDAMVKKLIPETLTRTAPEIDSSGSLLTPFLALNSSSPFQQSMKAAV